MAASLRSEVGSLHLSWRRELQRIDHAAALRMLQAAVAHGQSMRAMRNLLAEDAASAGLARLSDDDVLAHVAAKIEAGLIVAFRERAAGGIWIEREVAEPPPAVVPVTAVATETTWVEFELIGEDGQPIPNERYEVTLPDGTIKHGRLDRRGLARVDGIEQPGTCTFSFPDLDQEAWEDA